MIFYDILIISIILIFLASGIFINFIRNKNSYIEIAQKDKSLFFFRFFIPLSVGLSLVLYFTKKGFFKIPKIIILIGILFIIFGLILRWKAVKQLGNRFNVQVSYSKNQQLETKGVYTLIRHPSYTGSLIYYFGLGIVMQNYISILVLIVIPLIVILFRIKKEEFFMRLNFGKSYEIYQVKSYKLIPYLY